MKKIVHIALILGLLMPAFTIGVVAAEDGSSNSGSSSSGSGSSDTTKTDDKTVAADTATETENDTPTTTLDERLTQNKTEFKETLNKSAQLVIKTKCKAAQGLLSSLQGRITGIQTSRAAVYKNITDHLTSLQTKLQSDNVDTTELQAEITTLQAKITTYKTDLTTYKQAVADLAAMDCASDPTAFKSTLEAARAAHDKVVKDILDIRSYVNDTIKPTLVKIRTALEATEQKEQQ